MTVFAGPYDTGNMAQPQWEEVESKLWADGVIAGARNTFVTTTTSGLGISVNTGDAVLDGFRFYSDAATPLTAATADPSLPRIDLLVLRIDEVAHTSTIALKTGTPASSPVAPTATKTPGGTYELGLYQVRVNAASATITSLTDVRTYAAPVKHATAHASGGSDPIAPGDIGAVAKSGDTMTGTLTLTNTLAISASAASAGFEIGSTAAANTPFIDFHSSGNVNDYDVRLIATGGAVGVGQGGLTINAAAGTIFTGPLIGASAGIGIPMTRNGAAASVPIYTGTTTPVNPPTGSLWFNA